MFFFTLWRQSQLQLKPTFQKRHSVRPLVQLPVSCSSFVWQAKTPVIKFPEVQEKKKHPKKIHPSEFFWFPRGNFPTRRKMNWREIFPRGIFLFPRNIAKFIWVWVFFSFLIKLVLWGSILRQGISPILTASKNSLIDPLLLSRSPP